jgi:hypothetical protein
LTYRDMDYFEEEGGGDKTKNLRNDFGYLKDLRRFVDKVVADGKQTDKAFLQLSLSHMSFLAQDFDAVDKYTKQAVAAKSSNPAISIQLKITEVLNQVSKKLDANAEQAIVNLMAFLDKEQHQILDYKMLKSQLMRWFAERFFAKGEVAKGVLLTSKHHMTLGFGSNDGGYGNFYHKLLELGAPKDYEAILALLDKKTGLTPFETFLVSDPKPYAEYYDCYMTKKQGNHIIQTNRQIKVGM